MQARERQRVRQGAANARLTSREIERYCPVTSGARTMLERASTVMGLSARSYHRILKVARTISDLAEREAIDAPEVSEAIALRRLDRGRMTGVPSPSPGQTRAGA